MPETRNDLTEMILTEPLSFVEFGEVIYEPGGTFGPRVQGLVQLVAVHAGEASIETDGGPVHLNPGQATLLLPGGTEFFEFSRDNHTRHSWCNMGFASPELVCGRLGAYPPLAPLSIRLESILRLGIGAYEYTAPLHMGVVWSLARAALLEYLSIFESETAGARGEYPECLTHALTFMTMNCERRITLGDMAEAAHVSPAHLIRVCKRHLGKSPVKALWDYRLERAAGMLRESGAAVSTICWQLGFASPAHFSRAFRARFGVSPREYRLQAWARSC